MHSILTISIVNAFKSANYWFVKSITVDYCWLEVGGELLNTVFNLLCAMERAAEAFTVQLSKSIKTLLSATSKSQVCILDCRAYDHLYVSWRDNNRRYL